MNGLQVLAIVGPTAAGKTALSIALARRLDAEIVSLDAYQIYRGMDIGTAKPSAAELAEVPHHLIDVVEIAHDATIVEFQAWATAAIADINSRGKLAICVGGSGLYVRAALDELEVPPTDPKVRAKYEARLDQIGAAALHAELAGLDPTAAALILPGNTRRVVRALEVIELTGGQFQASLPAPESRYRDLRVGLEVPREQLAVRIRQRVEAMMAADWPAEVEELTRLGLWQTRTASKALGYREVAEFNQGVRSRIDTVDAVTAATLKFSKRQLQWFRRDPRVHWLRYDSPALVDDVLALR